MATNTSEKQLMVIDVSLLRSDFWLTFYIKSADFFTRADNRTYISGGQINGSVEVRNPDILIIVDFKGFCHDFRLRFNEWKHPGIVGILPETNTYEADTEKEHFPQLEADNTVPDETIEPVLSNQIGVPFNSRRD